MPLDRYLAALAVAAAALALGGGLSGMAAIGADLSTATAASQPSEGEGGYDGAHAGGAAGRLPHAGQRASHGRPCAGAVSGLRILVAEDHPGIAAAVARGLRRHGAAVDVAPNGADALLRARLHFYDVVVLDRDLPEVHGDDVCRALVDERPETKVLMLTAAGTTDDLVAGLALGADDYLPKPFRFAELVARVHALARRAASHGHPSCATAISSSIPRGGRRPAAAGSSVSLRRSSASSRRCWRPMRRGLRRRAPRARLGREHRPVHHHGSHDGDEAATQARRAGRPGDRPGAGYQLAQPEHA